MHRPNKTLNDLRALARMHGVKTSYVTMDKGRQLASPETLLAMLRTLGVPIERENDVLEALRGTRRTLASQVLEPVHVAWRGKPATVPLQLPEWASAGRLRLEWSLEQGEVRLGETRLERLPVERVVRVDGECFATRLVPVPESLPEGYHRLALECGPNRFETHIFRASERCFQGSRSRRSWGVFAPLYALHSGRSWGAGDFGDLADFITWLNEQGGRFVGTLPLLPAFLDQPCEPSPYSPISRLFWNEFYLDIGRVPELLACPAARRLMRSSCFQERLSGLQQSPLVDYAAQMTLKRQVLEAFSRSFFVKPSPRRSVFEKFMCEHPHVADYARFRSVHEQRGESWTQWPMRMRRGELHGTDCHLSLRQYHSYVQWLAHEQMAQLSEHAEHHRVDLYLDMPLGTHRDGYDAWRYQELFALRASGGAPPDPVFTQGQDWGFAPIHPQRSREQGHAYIRAYLCHHLRHARMLRFDHVMGMHRLYWVPCGSPASQGAYVTYPAEEFYAMLSIESHRHHAVIVGENLGTVPAEVNRSLKRHGIGSMFVAQYEVRPLPHVALRRIPGPVVASLNTHDMPPFAAFWEGLDIPDRRNLGLIKRQDLPGAERLREGIRRSLLRLLRRRGRLGRGDSAAGAVFQASVQHLGLSAARWVLLNLEDLWLETASQNMPGTSTERVNWRRKTRLSLEQMRNMPAVLKLLGLIRRLRGPS